MQRQIYDFMLKHRREICCLEIMQSEQFERKVCFVRADPTLLVRLGTPDRPRPSDILCCADEATTTTNISDLLEFCIY